MKKVGIYIRVSTDEQIENHSIPAQTERLEAYCKAHDYIIAKKYIDGGKSGANTDRPALQELIRDSKNHLIDGVIAYKLDRLSRSQKDMLYLIEDIFLPNDVAFVSMQESFDTSTAFGRAMVGILSVFAQLEREQIKERTMMGKAERAKEGLFHGGGWAPFGYRYIANEGLGSGRLVVNEYEAMQVREIFELFAYKQYTMAKIRNVMAEKYPNSHNGWGSANYVLNIIKNSIYTGVIKYRNEEFEGQHDPIITKELYREANHYRLSKSRKEGLKVRQKESPFAPTTLLGGLAVCGYCGRAYICRTGGKKLKSGYVVQRKYACSNRMKSARSIGADKCENKIWKIDELDDLIINEIRKLKFDDGEKITKIEIDRKENLINRIGEIDKRTEKLIELYQVSSISIDQVSDKMDLLAKEKENLLCELDDAEGRNDLSGDEVKEILDTFEEIFDCGSLEQKRALIISLVDQIEIIEENVSIRWRF